MVQRKLRGLPLGSYDWPSDSSIPMICSRIYIAHWLSSKERIYVLPIRVP